MSILFTALEAVDPPVDSEAAGSKAVDPKKIDWWSRYTRSRFWHSPEEARDWIFSTRQHWDRQEPPSMQYGAAFNRAFADAMPVYQLKMGKRERWSKRVLTWKIGKPVRAQIPRWSWKELEIRGNSQYDLYHTAEASGLVNYSYRKELIALKDLDLSGYEGERARIENLAKTIRTNEYIERVIVARWSNGEMDLLEGQHRARAFKWVFRASHIPADVIEESPESDPTLTK